MLISFKDGIANTHCEGCGKISDFDLSNKICYFLEEFGEYENLPLSCTGCNSIEVFNMNLDVEENTENFEITEQIQRDYIKDLIRSVRGDFVEGGI